LTPVKLGLLNNNIPEWEILSGVQATDRIVVDPKNLKGKVVPVEVKNKP
jgi:hypothetical protein